MLHLLHRYLALATFLILGSAALQLLRNEARRKTAAAILALLILELVVGGLTVLSGLSLWLVLAHGLIAAALLVSVATLLRR
jgi:cytochrome c oxidase assembly protein subunit 15